MARKKNTPLAPPPYEPPGIDPKTDTTWCRKCRRAVAIGNTKPDEAGRPVCAVGSMAKTCEQFAKQVTANKARAKAPART